MTHLLKKDNYWVMKICQWYDVHNLRKKCVKSVRESHLQNGQNVKHETSISILKVQNEVQQD